MNLKKIDAKWYYMLSELFNKGAAYAIILMLSYFLSPKQYGYISLFNSILTLSLVFVSLNITRTYITRAYCEKGANIKEIIETVVSFLATFNILIFGIIFVLTKIDVIYSVPTTLIIAGILCAMTLPCYEILQAILIVENKKIVYSSISVIYSILLVILTLVYYIINPNLGAFSFIFAKFSVGLLSTLGCIIFFVNKYKIRFRINKEIIKPALIYSIPLILHTLSGFILNYLDKFMLNDMVGIDFSAKYAFAHNIAMIINILVNAINQAFLPKFYRYMNENNFIEIDKNVKHNTKILLLIIVAYTFLVDIFLFLMPSAYRNMPEVIFMLIFSYILFHGYVIYSNYLYYRKNTMAIFINTTICGVVNIILNSILIAKFNAIGATIATLISFVLMYILFYLNAKREYKNNVFDIKQMTKYILLASIIVIGYWIVRQYIFVKYIYMIIVCIGLYKFLIKRDDRF